MSKLPPTPEAPIWLSREEANAWEQGWEAGAAACRAAALEGREKMVEKPEVEEKIAARFARAERNKGPLTLLERWKKSPAFGIVGITDTEIRRAIAIAQAVREKLPMMSCTCLRVIEQRADELLEGK